MAGVGLVLLQQLTGQPSVLYYANRIFEDAGLGYSAAVGVGLFKLVITIAAASLVEKVGRRPLLLSGTAIMTVCLAVLSYIFAGTDPNTALTTQQQLVRIKRHAKKMVRSLRLIAMTEFLNGAGPSCLHRGSLVL